MTAPAPEPLPEAGQPSAFQPFVFQPPAGERAQGGELSEVRFTWVPGSEENGVGLSGPVPPEALPGHKPPAGTPPAGLDWQALVEALGASGRLGGDPDQQEAELADVLEAREDGRMGPSMDPGQLAALAVEHMEPGPALAGWLEVAAQAAPQLNEDQLTRVAIAARAQVARTQAVELVAIGQLTARAAAADRQVGLKEDGRPTRVCRDAAAQLEMALMLSHNGAEARADLAVTLTWRLPCTCAALATGCIDLDRAKIIAQYTGVLSEEKAREVEAAILPQANQLTTAHLRQRLDVLVLRADPAGAEERRKNAESNADVRLFSDNDQTATLIASKLPQIEASAAYGRINAMARARKQAGMPGSLQHHRARILLEMALGTLELTPAPDDAPPDQAPPPDDEPPPPGEPPADGNPGPSASPRPGPGDGSPSPSPSDASDGGPRDDLPAPRDEDAPEDDGLDDAGADGPDDSWDPWESDDDLDGNGPAPAWPRLGTIPPALARADRRKAGTPPTALLEVTLPWASYAGLADEPGILGRIGAITARQARQLTQPAEGDPAAQWRVIVTDSDGHALAVTRVRRRIGPARRGPPGTGPPGTGPPAGAGLTGRVTLVISEDVVARYMPAAGPPGGIAGAALRAAARALERARDQAQADAAAGGCAHQTASPGYRPPRRLREQVIARDLTCRNPVCGQPAWRADLDHTRPYDQGGRTCGCNLGGACRRDHQLKQHSRWKLEQIRPGWFRWTAPSGRTYVTGPERYLA